MSIDKEDSKNAIRIAVSRLVQKLQVFFYFDNFSTFQFFNFFFFYLKARGKSRQMALGVLSCLFKMSFLHCYWSKMDVLKTFPNVKMSNKIQIWPLILPNFLSFVVTIVLS